MIFGLIYNKYAIIESKQNHFDLHINWHNHLNTKEISKNVSSAPLTFLLKNYNKLTKTGKNLT